MKVLFYEHIATSVYKEHELKRRCKYSTIIKKLGLKGCFCVIDGDETLYYPDCKDLKPKSNVIHIKRVPEKSAGNMMSAIVGAVLVTAGVITGIALGWTGVGAFVAAGLITAGASMMVGAGISELMAKNPNVPSLKSQSQQEERYGLTGTSNRVSLGSKYPVIFGRHVITPPIVGNYYTELENNTGTGDQFMRVLLCVGYNQLKLTDFKIGLNELASNSGDIRNGRIPTTGTYDADIEIRQDGLYPDLYQYRRYEEQVSAEVKYFASEADYTETRTTVKNTTGIYIILSFQGLYSVSSEGRYQNAAATIGVKYRPKTGGAWTLLGETTYRNNKNSLLRYFVTKQFSSAEMENNPTGEWEVIVYRTSPASTSSTSVNKCYWATLRSDTAQRPVIQKELDKMCVVALKIRANEQTSGILDQISCVAQSVFPVWDGVDWNTSAPTSNPASCYLGALQSNFLTRKVADDRIDWDALQAFYEWCDTNNYNCNGIISNGEQVFNILNKILQTSRANFYLKDGLYSLTHDIPTTNPVALFTPKNSRNFTAQKLFPTHIDGMDVTFNDESNNWEADNQVIYPYGYVETGDETNQEMSAWGVTSYAQAVKLARYILACNELRPEIYQLTVGLENFSIPLGSRCLIQNDVLLVGLTGGRIKSVNGSKIQIDEVVKAPDLSKQYGLKVFHTDGTITSFQVNTPLIETDTLTAVGAFSAQPNDIYAFGTYGNETIDCLVTGKTIGDNLSGTLTFMPYAPEVFNCDSQPIPAYDPHITKPMQQGYSIIGDSLEPTKGIAVQDDGVVYYDFANYAMHDDAGDYFYNRGALLDLGKGYWSNLYFTGSSSNANSITEIPQDIKLELNNGVITLKSGSVTTAPNGTQTLTTEDHSNTTSGVGIWLVTCNPNGTLQGWTPINKWGSGSTLPADGSTYNYFLNTTEQKIYYWNGSSWQGTSWCLPIAICTADGTGVVSIDQVFNGFGYIGSSAFALPGVKGLIPNGRNEDGTLKNKPFTINSLLITTDVSGATGGLEYYVNGSGIFRANFGTYTYDPETNYITNSSQTVQSIVLVDKNAYRTSGKVTSFNPKPVSPYDGVLNWASSNGQGEVFFNVDNTLYKNTSISFFMKGLTLSASKKYIFQYNDSANQNVIELYTENNKLLLNCQGYVQEITGYDFSEKHHFCIIRDIEEAGFSIYIDGNWYANESYGTFTYNLESETNDNLIDEEGNNLISENYAVGIEDLDRTVNFYLFCDKNGNNGAACSIAKFRLYRRILPQKEIDILSADGIISSMIEILNRYLGEYVDAPDESKIGDTFDYSGTTNEDFINGERYVRTLSGWVLYGG